MLTVVQCAGLLWSTYGNGTAVGAFLFTTLNAGEAASLGVDQGAAIVVLSLAILGLRWPVRGFYGVIAAWFFLVPCVAWHVGGAPFVELSLPAHAVRFAVPLALAVWPASDAPDTPDTPDRTGRTGRASGSTGRASGIVWGLRIAVALTFAAHGVEALGLHPRFLDYLFIADERIFGFGLTQPGAEGVLGAIGAVDIALALLVLLRPRSRWVLVYMAVWGFVTAGSRIVHYGGYGLPMALIRVANGGLPLVLLFVDPRSTGPIHHLWSAWRRGKMGWVKSAFRRVSCASRVPRASRHVSERASRSGPVLFAGTSHP